MSLYLLYLSFYTLKLTHLITGHDFVLEVDSPCVLGNGAAGVCKRIGTCRPAIEMLSRRERPIICSFDRFYPLLPVVCCPSEKTMTPNMNQINQPLTNPGQTPNTDKINQPLTNSGQTTNPNQNPSVERPGLPRTNSVARIIEQCDQYSGRFYAKPLKEGQSGIFVVGGEDADPKEFPHVALLGFGNLDNIQWLCGGALISEDFVLTAAHCLSSNDFGPVRIVRLGDLDIKSDQDDADPRQFEVTQMFQHPQYDESNKYHDVALLRLNASVSFNIYIKPACLQTQNDLPNAQLVATGWGQTSFGGDSANILQKVELNSTDQMTCSRVYTRRINGLSRGLDNQLQICAEGKVAGGDTCQGDSGSPLQVKQNSSTLHTIVGITSFGINCGLVPGVYTRVSFYAPWIESVVWPPQ